MQSESSDKNKQIFVHVLEDEFIDFYNKYFARYHVDDDGIMVIEDEKIPLNYDAFLYWLLTTNDINEVIISFQDVSNDVWTEIIIGNNTITLKTSSGYGKTGRYILNTKIDNVYYLKQQLLEIKQGFTVVNRMSTHGFKFYANKIMNCQEKIGIHVSNALEIYFKQMGQPEVNNWEMSRVYYKLYGNIVQNRINPCTLYHNEADKDQVKKIVITNDSYIISEESNFAVILTGRYYADKWETKDKTIINFMIFVLPINYYYKTIGYHLGVLNSYYGSAKDMQGFQTWLNSERWNVSSNSYEDLYDKVRRKIIEKYIYGN